MAFHHRFTRMLLYRRSLPLCTYTAAASVICSERLGRRGACRLSTIATTTSSSTDMKINKDNGTDASNDNSLLISSARPELRKNEDLETVKKMGLAQLEACTRKVTETSNSRKPLFVPDEDTTPTPDQIAEARRVLGATQQALNQLTRKDSLFTIQGDPIELLDVEVSRDLRQARVHWTLPFWMMEYPEDVHKRATERMQDILDKRGGKIQTLVHAQLRHYYPPKLRFVAADGDLLRLTLKGVL